MKNKVEVKMYGKWINLSNSEKKETKKIMKKQVDEFLKENKGLNS